MALQEKVETIGQVIRALFALGLGIFLAIIINPTVNNLISSYNKGSITTAMILGKWLIYFFVFFVLIAIIYFKKKEDTA